jgi:AcrR family transcriptional regulator
MSRKYYFTILFDNGEKRVYIVCMSNQISQQEKTRVYRSDNRKRFIEAAYTILSERGIEETTIKEIARLAGVSSGLFSYYFASKDELLLAVLEEAGARFKQRLLQTLQQERFPQNFPAAALAVIQDMPRKEPAWFRLRYEFYALGLRDSHFLLAVGELLAHIQQEIAQTLQQLTGVPETQSQAVAAVILACFDGLALQQLTRPEVDFTRAYALVGQMAVSSCSPDP